MREREREYSLLFYWVVCKNKNWNVGCIVRWVGKIDKVMFKDVKYVFFFLHLPLLVLLPSHFVKFLYFDLPKFFFSTLQDPLRI